MDSNKFELCCCFLPKASVPEAIDIIHSYLVEHPGWSETELNIWLSPLATKVAILEGKVAELERKVAALGG